MEPSPLAAGQQPGDLGPPALGWIRGSCRVSSSVPGPRRGLRGTRSATRGWSDRRAAEASSCTPALGWGPLASRGAVLSKVLVAIPVSPGMPFCSRRNRHPVLVRAWYREGRRSSTVCGGATGARAEHRHRSPAAVCPQGFPCGAVPGHSCRWCPPAFLAWHRALCACRELSRRGAVTSAFVRGGICSMFARGSILSAIRWASNSCVYSLVQK